MSSLIIFFLYTCDFVSTKFAQAHPNLNPFSWKNIVHQMCSLRFPAHFFYRQKCFNSSFHHHFIKHHFKHCKFIKNNHQCYLCLLTSLKKTAGPNLKKKLFVSLFSLSKIVCKNEKNYNCLDKFKFFANLFIFIGVEFKEGLITSI